MYYNLWKFFNLYKHDTLKLLIRAIFELCFGINFAYAVVVMPMYVVYIITKTFLRLESPRAKCAKTSIMFGVLASVVPFSVRA